MKVSVKASELFTGAHTGGLEFGDWLTLDDEGQLKQRLSFIAHRANALAQTTYTSDCGLPGQIIGDAQLLHAKALDALSEAHERNFIRAGGLALEVGQAMNDLNRQMAVYGHLQLEAEAQKLRPHAERGRKLIQGASSGGSERNSQWRQLRTEYQPYIDDLHKRNPHLSYAGLRHHAAEHFGVSPETIKKHTTNPKAGTC